MNSSLAYFKGVPVKTVPVQTGSIVAFSKWPKWMCRQHLAVPKPHFWLHEGCHKARDLIHVCAWCVCVCVWGGGGGGGGGGWPGI